MKKNASVSLLIEKLYKYRSNHVVRDVHEHLIRKTPLVFQDG